MPLSGAVCRCYFLLTWGVFPEQYTGLKIQLNKEQQCETLPQRAAKMRLSRAALVLYVNTAVPESQDGCKDGCLPKGIYFSCNFLILEKTFHGCLEMMRPGGTVGMKGNGKTYGAGGKQGSQG